MHSDCHNLLDVSIYRQINKRTTSATTQKITRILYFLDHGKNTKQNRINKFNLLQKRFSTPHKVLANL